MRRTAIALACAFFAAAIGASTATTVMADGDRDDAGVLGAKLVLKDTGAKQRVVYIAKDGNTHKGPDGDPALVSGSFLMFYNDNSTQGLLNMPQGLWRKNNNGRATYRNRSATISDARNARISELPALRAKLISDSLGGLDITNDPSNPGVLSQFVFNNGVDGSVHRLCTLFSTAAGSIVRHKTKNGRTRLILKRGVGSSCEANCSDGEQNGDESDIDCGGSVCPVCPDGGACFSDSDCTNGVCVGGLCVVPTCTDGVANGDETDTDCGGSCPACPDGSLCTGDVDCTSGVCVSVPPPFATCQEPTCVDGVLNGDETDTDCGGSCPVCPDGGGCSVDADCSSGVCSGGVCQVPTCSDGVSNGDETGTDCGGSCPACPEGEGCAVNADCASTVCVGGICFPVNCADLVLNGDETDIDCGGSCPECQVGENCLVGVDCTEGVCTGGTCDPPNCVDGVANGDEPDVDCGGGSCPTCADGSNCYGPNDCTSGYCDGPTVPPPFATCQTPTCTDGIQNGSETDVDCGGDLGNLGCGATCNVGDDCNVGGDCSTGACNLGVCDCGNQNFNFSTGSNSGGSFDPAEWPGGTQTLGTAPCDATADRPSGNLDLVGNLGDDWAVLSFGAGFSNCNGSGGEDGDGCSVGGCPPAGFGSCESNRPSCSAALNGTGSSNFNVSCNQ